MIKKPRPIPLIVHFGQALLSRLNPNHSKIPSIEKDIRIYMSGYRGEIRTDYHLQYLNDKNQHIFRGLRLPNGQNHFQVDTIVLSRQKILLLETKNHPGKIDISQEQFTQKTNYGEKGYNNPIIQVNHHKEQLQNWLDSHRLPTVPIITLVVLSHPSAIIKSTDPAILKQMCKVDNVQNKILTLTKHYHENILTDRGMKKISKLLLRDDTPLYPDSQRTYGIPLTDLIQGVRCPKCFRYRMLRKDRVWICPHCFYHARNPYYDALLDYFLLIKPTITNREFREFLGIDSMKTATYMLASINLPSMGEKKGRVYHRPDDFLDQLEERYKNQG